MRGATSSTTIHSTPSIPATVREAARAAYNAGLSVYPPREDGSKRSDADHWKPYQTTRPSLDTLRRLYHNGRAGVGIFCGAVSGNLEAFEFDGGGSAYEPFKAAARAAGLGDVVERVAAGYEESSPTGGSTELAKRPTRPDERKGEHGTDRVLIETRGAAARSSSRPRTAACIRPVAPTACAGAASRPSPRLRLSERADPFAVARSLDARPRRRARAQLPPPTGTGDRPGDVFNVRASLDDLRAILDRAGWRHVYSRGEEEF